MKRILYTQPVLGRRNRSVQISQAGADTSLSLKREREREVIQVPRFRLALHRGPTQPDRARGINHGRVQTSLFSKSSWLWVTKFLSHWALKYFWIPSRCMHWLYINPMPTCVKVQRSYWKHDRLLPCQSYFWRPHNLQHYKRLVSWLHNIVFI